MRLRAYYRSMGEAETIGVSPDFENNNEAIEAWDGVLFDRFVEFRDALVSGLGAHGNRALDLYPPEPGQRALDIGCGFGDTTRQIARLVGPEGEAVGVDASPRFIAASREEAATEGVENVRYAVADVEAGLPDEVGGDFDRVFSRMGTMFFANPVPAMRRIRATMRPGALLTMVVWRQKADNVFMYDAEQITERFLTHPDQTDEPTCGPGPFSMANADTTSGIMKAAGFENIALTRSDGRMWQGDTIDEALDLVMAIGPAGELIRVNEQRGEELRPQIVEALKEGLARYVTPEGVYAATSTWIVAARNPA
jgi:SAM-dependent methyltransferase